MPRRSTYLVARLLWAFPALLLFLTVNQVDVARDLQRTLEEGAPYTAEVTGFFSSNREEVKFDYVDLRVTLSDGRTIERAQLAIPHAFAPVVEERGEVDVRVLQGADQEIVIERAGDQLVGRPQYRLAFINAAMSLMALIGVTIGVYAWNRYLDRRGDPADQPAGATHPAEG